NVLQYSTIALPRLTAWFRLPVRRWQPAMLYSLRNFQQKQLDSWNAFRVIRGLLPHRASFWRIATSYLVTTHRLRVFWTISKKSATKHWLCNHGSPRQHSERLSTSSPAVNTTNNTYPTRRVQPSCIGNTMVVIST